MSELRLSRLATTLPPGTAPAPAPASGDKAAADAAPSLTGPQAPRNDAPAAVDTLHCSTAAGGPSKSLQLGGIPELPPVPGPFEPRHRAAGVVLDGMPYQRRHLAEAIHILSELAGARMAAVGRAKVSYGKSETTAAMEAAGLELKGAKSQRYAAWWNSGAGLLDKVGGLATDDVGGRMVFGALSEALSTYDKSFGYARTATDVGWQRSYVSLRERIAKQLEDMHNSEYEKAVRQLERSLETTRQMAQSNTDTLRGVSQNL